MQIYANFVANNHTMKQRLKWIVFSAMCLILCNQTIHLYRLYQEYKARYVYQRNDLLDGFIYEFNIKNTNIKNAHGYNASTDELTFVIDNKVIRKQLHKKDEIRKISIRCLYDTRDIRKWTLEHLYEYAEMKQDSMQVDMPHLQFTILDSLGKIVDSFPPSHEAVPENAEYCRPLGYISPNTLYATYDYPAILFAKAAAGQIIITIVITVLFVLFIIDFFRSIQKEKKRGEYREMFIHQLVHDLKHPVANQIKMGYLLQEKMPEDLRPLFEQSQSQLNGMLQSINRMLLQSTDERGLKLNLQAVDLHQMLESLTVPVAWNLQTDQQLHIETVFQTEHPTVTGDYHFLAAVFQNLIDNAIKYSGNDTRISIHCSEPDSGQVQISIRDNGPGIPAEDLKHIFERYYRGNGPKGKKIKGHGLGLFYARLVLEAHGGNIRIESTEGKGTRVIATLYKEPHIPHKYRK